nr:hypothetical protein [Neobacillus sp. Marseille-Q6967]
MEEKKDRNALQVDFSEVVKKAYEKGTNEREITVNNLIEEIKTDLKSLRFS